MRDYDSFKPMSRVKLTEYKAKKLISGDAYVGYPVRSGDALKLPTKQTYVGKVDEGVKKRFKNGLIAVNVAAPAIAKKMKEWHARGFSQFIIEPYFEHDISEEQYLSLERVRSGIRVLHTKEGGVDIEAHPEKVATYILTSKDDNAKVSEATGLPLNFLQELLGVFEENFFAFVEINPLVLRGSEVHLLDAAVLVDSAGTFFVHEAWKGSDVVGPRAQHKAEKNVEALAATTPAALSLKVLNKDGALFFLLSGGGGSIVIVDEVASRGAGKLIGNYGEYSGGPTREETYLYAKEVIALMLASKWKPGRGGSASGGKALVIAGGVANFTDIKQTFAGIIDALTETAVALRTQRPHVQQRRPLALPLRGQRDCCRQHSLGARLLPQRAFRARLERGGG